MTNVPPPPPPPAGPPPPPQPPTAGYPRAAAATAPRRGSKRWIALGAAIVIVVVIAAGVVLALRSGGKSPSGATAGSASTVWTFTGAVNASLTIQSTRKCPESVDLLDHSGNEWDLTLGGPSRDGTFGATDPALTLFALSNVDLTSYWLGIDTIGAYQGVGQGASGTVSRSGNVYSIDATLVPWTKVAPKTSGNLHIKGSVAC